MGPVASLALAAGGTALLIGVANLLQFKAQGRFASVEAATGLANLAPDAVCASAMSLDGAACLVALRDGTLCLLEAVGDKAVVRTIGRADIETCTRGVAILAGDGLGRPSRMLVFDEQELAAVMASATETAWRDIQA